MLDAVKELHESGKAEIQGNLDLFFNCKDLGGTEKWVELQEICPEEMLEKVMSETGSPTQVLKVTIKDGEKSVAHIIMRAWKECRLHRRLRKYKRGI